MTLYKGWETATSLLLAYETTARAHRAAIRNAPIEAGETEPHEYFSYSHGFALLILNASIVEGTMRTILTERVMADLNSAIARNNAAGIREHTPPDRLIARLLRDLESSGGWQKISELSATYLGAPIDEPVTKDTKEGIEVLFTLRNILAHGTALIHPNARMGQDKKDEYPYDWQRRLQRVADYMEAQFKRGSVFKNLAHPDMPEHFMEITKSYFAELQPHLATIPERAAITIGMISRYQFGYVDTMR